jgi:DNA gyrase subunit A
LRTMGRATQGVRLISLKGKDEIAAVCRTPKEEEDNRNLDADGEEGEAPDAAESDDANETED